MKKINIFILVLVFLMVIPGVLSESISQASFFIKVYNNTIEIVSDEYIGNNQNFTFGIASRNDTVVNGNDTVQYEVRYVPYQDFNYTFIFVKNISVDISLVEKWASCLNDTTNCKLEAAANFTQCSVDKTNKDNDITNKNLELEKLKKEKTDTQNQKFLFAIGGAVLAILILFAAQGKFGKKVKQKSEEFSKTTAS